MKQTVLRLLPIIDLILLPFLYPAASLLKSIRRLGIQEFPQCRNALRRIGVFPIQDHYYEPQFNFQGQKQDFSLDRNLTGIKWNISRQLEVIGSFIYANELTDIPSGQTNELGFYFGNGSFESGDAEYWYQLIRTVKPRRIVEIGCGNSTLMAMRAIQTNHQQDDAYTCEHICIEPYEMSWLESLDVSVVRERVENIDLSFFKCLEENDILFIDSSHVIRPCGDLIFEYLELLPSLKKGVIVHVHDIFSPKNYPEFWLKDQVRFWNEQYLLEAFLSHNADWEILGALNYLHHHYYDELKEIAPFLSPEREPGSFYIRKVN